MTLTIAQQREGKKKVFVRLCLPSCHRSLLGQLSLTLSLPLCSLFCRAPHCLLGHEPLPFALFFFFSSSSIVSLRPFRHPFESQQFSLALFFCVLCIVWTSQSPCLVFHSLGTAYGTMARLMRLMPRSPPSTLCAKRYWILTQCKKRDNRVKSRTT